MIYFLAIVLSPIAVLFVGKPIQALLNLLLILLGWLPGVIHAVVVINHHKADKRTNALIKALQHKH